MNDYRRWSCVVFGPCYAFWPRIGLGRTSWMTLVARWKSRNLLHCQIQLISLKIVRYFFVGGAAAIIDVSLFFCSRNCWVTTIWWSGVRALSLLLRSTIFWAFVSVFAAGRAFQKRTELAFIYAISLIGLGLNQLILLLLVEQAGVELMQSKSSATGGVFLWSFSNRNFIVFHGEKQGAPKLHK